MPRTQAPRCLTLATALSAENVDSICKALLADVAWDTLRQLHSSCETAKLMALVSKLDSEMGDATNRTRAHRVTFECAEDKDTVTVDFPARSPPPTEAGTPSLSTSEPAAAVAPASTAATPPRRPPPNAHLDEALSLLEFPMEDVMPPAAATTESAERVLSSPDARKPKDKGSPSGAAAHKSPHTGPRAGSRTSSRLMGSPLAPPTPTLTNSRKRSLDGASS